jgi:hypothetical protein
VAGDRAIAERAKPSSTARRDHAGHHADDRDKVTVREDKDKHQYYVATARR